MDRNITLSVIGGDTRQAYAADALKALGYQTALCGFTYFNAFRLRHPQIDLTEALAADVIVLPLPYSKNGADVFAPFAQTPIPLQTVFASLGSGQRLLLGNADEQTVRRLGLHGADAYDYFKDDALTLRNARFTAEGLLGIAVESLPVALLEARIAIVGYGRIGFYTAWLFSACGAKATVFARSPLQLAKASAAGLQTRQLSRFADEKRCFDCLINTVPAQILKERELSALNGDCLLVEAASAPFGIDAEAAKSLGFRLVKAASLPGKVSPKSAGEAIASTIDQLVRR